MNEPISDFPAGNPFHEAGNGNWPKFRPGQFSMFGERGKGREYGAPRFPGRFCFHETGIVLEGFATLQIIHVLLTLCIVDRGPDLRSLKGVSFPSGESSSSSSTAAVMAFLRDSRTSYTRAALQSHGAS